MSVWSPARSRRVGVFLILGLAMAWGRICYSNSLIAKDFSQEEVMVVEQTAASKAQTVEAMHETTLMKIPGVVGVGIGLSEKGDHAAIHVFVNANAPFYSPTAIPKHLEGVPVRIIEGGDIMAQ